jgi:hypothetical protein
MSETENEMTLPKQSLWQKNKVSLTGMTLFSLGIALGFVGGWLAGRRMTGQSLVPVPIDDPGTGIFIPYTSPSPQMVYPTEPGAIEPWPIPDGVACTMEAKQCPDGSYVGRQGPNCEFAPCSGANSGSGTSGNSGSAVDLPTSVSTSSPAFKNR